MASGSADNKCSSSKHYTLILASTHSSLALRLEDGKVYSTTCTRILASPMFKPDWFSFDSHVTCS